MPITVSGGASFALCYAGLSALCLTMDRHQQQIRQRSGSARERQALRIAGWLLLILSLVACLSGWGVGVGPVIWLGALSASTAALVLLLPYAPRAVVPCAAITGSTGLLLATLQLMA